MFNPVSWSLDSWFTVLQIASAIILGVTVAVGYFLSQQQKVEIAKVRTDAANELAIKTEAVRQEAKTEQSRIETDAQKEIARLTADAEKAREGIETAKADAARAKEGIASAEARSLEASAEVSRLQVVVANAEKERTEAQKALLELQLRVNNRVITAEQAEKFLAFVSRFKERGKVAIECPNGTPETVNFGAQIQNLLRKAGWDVTLGTPLMSGGKTYFGVNLLLARFGKKTPEDPSYHAAVMAKGFEAAGIKFGSQEVKGQAPDHVRLIVAPNFKP